jgi:hypothetical protein
MLRLDSLVAFIATAEGGSISEAARLLQISKSVASERLAELERNVGATLVHRSTWKLTLTEDGIAFLERARRILREVSEASAEVSERRGALVGPLRISVPVSFGILHLTPALNSFLRRNPRIELSLDLNDRFVCPKGGVQIRSRPEAGTGQIDLAGQKQTLDDSKCLRGRSRRRGTDGTRLFACRTYSARMAAVGEIDAARMAGKKTEAWLIAMTMTAPTQI